MTQGIKALVVTFVDGHDKILEKALTDLGCVARRTEDILFEAFRITREWSPELILVECGHPEMPAWDFAYEVRNMSLPHRPYLVGMTGRDSRTEKALCEEFGFDAYKKIPIYLKDMMVWVRDCEDSLGREGGLNLP